MMFHAAEMPNLKASWAVPTLAEVPMNSDISIRPTRTAGTPEWPDVPDVNVVVVLTERWMKLVSKPNPTMYPITIAKAK
jgi:hypothetical protein